jgi:hypothetical protein
MANAVYARWKQSLMTEADTNKSLDQTGTSAPFAALVSATYTYVSTHQFYSSLAGVVGTDVAITTPTVVNGLFDGDDCTFTSVSGSAVTAIVIYRKNTGANTTWRLVLYEDTSVTGLPVTPNGGNIQITWSASGIFQLCDYRLKTNINKVGKVGRANIYEFNYLGLESQRFVGPMAQEVEQYAPDAVREIAGYKVVNLERALAA